MSICGAQLKGVIMTKLSITLTVFISLLISSVSGAAVSCTEDIYSRGILEAVDSNLENALNQRENAYEWGIALSGYDSPKFCSIHKGYVTVLISVEVNRWDDEGYFEEDRKADCYMDLDKQDSNWVPAYIICEDLDVEKEL